MQSRRPRVELITAAEQSPEQQLRHRKRQYLGLMLLRVICLILASVLVSLRVPYALVWALILTAGMIAFPWMAVMIANDRPPQASSRFTTRFRRGPSAPRELPAQPPQLPQPPTVIDVEQ